MLLNEGKPLFFQPFVHIPEAGGRMTVYVNFRIGHQPLKLSVGDNLTEQTVIDFAAFQKLHCFIIQVQLH